MFNFSTTREMVQIAFQYLSGRKLRTALTTLSIVFGVALIFAMNLVLPSALSAFNKMLSTTSGAADLTITSATGEAFSAAEPLKTTTAVDGVKAVSGGLRRQVSLPISGDGLVGKATEIEFVGIDPTTFENVRQMIVTDGRFLTPADSGKVLLPAAIADIAPQVKVGTTFPMITAGGLKLYTVVGLVTDQGNKASLQMYMTLKDAQEALNQTDVINTIEVALQPGADKNTVSSAIQKSLGGGFKINAPQDALAAFTSIQSAFAVFNLLGLFALFMGGFLIFNTFRTVVVERKHDLGMLRAIGAKQSQLTQLILIEGVVQGVFGTVLGLIIGYLFALLMAAGYRAIAKSLFAGLSVDVAINAQALGLAVGLGLLTTLAAAYFPSRAAARIAPLEALRPVSTDQIKRTAQWGLSAGIIIIVLSVILMFASKQSSGGGAVLFLVGVILISPSLVLPLVQLFSPLLAVVFTREGTLAEGNLIRQPGRAAVTASTLMIGLAVFIAMGAIVNSFEEFLVGMTTRNFASDILIVPPTIGIYGSVVGMDENFENRLRSVPEVKTVGGLRFANGVINAQNVQVMGIDPVNYPKVTTIDFSQGNPDEAYTALDAGRNLLMNTTAASTLKLKYGDTVTLQTAEGPQQYKIIGLVTDVLTFKLNTVFLSYGNMKNDFHKAEDVLAMINLKPGIDQNAALANIQGLLKDYPQFTAKLTGEYRKYILDATAGGLGAMYFLAVLLLIPAVLGLLNTLTINVMERTREIGVVRAVGGNRGQVRRIVMAEALLLGLFGVVIGIFAGVALSYGFTLAISNIGWEIPYKFPLGAIIAAIIGSIVLALLASILPARNAAKMDIIRALQYE